jgi:hypothetical protein
MYSYWKDVHKVGMLSCLLDPHFKKLRFVKQRIRYKAIDELRDLYEIARLDHDTSDDMMPALKQTNSTGQPLTTRKSILDMIYASPNEPADSTEEIVKYLEINEVGIETFALVW